MRKIIVILTVLFCLGSTSSFAAQFPFDGEDINTNSDPEKYRLWDYPNANAAMSLFTGALIGVGTQDFEGFTPFADGAPLLIDFPGSTEDVKATLKGGGFVGTPIPGYETDTTGIYPISGTKYWDSGSNFSIEFSSPVAAFGFYGVDIGDFTGTLQLEFISSTSTTKIDIPSTPNNAGGAVLYFGFIDDTNPFTSVNFTNTGSGTDYFGFDDFTIGTLDQVKEVPNVAPIPSTFLLFGTGIIMLIGFKRKHLLDL